MKISWTCICRLKLIGYLSKLFYIKCFYGLKAAFMKTL